MKKRILASLLGLTMMVTPVVAFAQPVNVPTDVLVAGVANVAQFIEMHEGRAYFGLRRVAEAYLGEGSVQWNQANQTVVITFNGADVAARFDASAGTNIADSVRPGTFTLELAHVNGGLYIANGPVAGTRLVASFINDRHMIPAGAFTAALPADAAAIYGESGLATNLIQTALTVLTGRAVNYNVTPAGVEITLGDAVTLPNLPFTPPTTAVTLPAVLPPTTAVTLPAEIPTPAVDAVAEPTAPAGRFTPGTFTGTSENTYSHRPDNEGGYSPGPLVVEVVFSADAIVSFSVVSTNDGTPWVNMSVNGLTSRIEGATEQLPNTLRVDTISGATYTSFAVLEAVNNAIAAAEAR
ncbi:MAG: FMN-binding protein [Defluviitaleaceae bacterium]|nr:FMN-binding protein [Defluviitaleaceae bacterium]